MKVFILARDFEIASVDLFSMFGACQMLDFFIDCGDGKIIFAYHVVHLIVVLEYKKSI